MFRTVFALALVAVAAPAMIGNGTCGDPACAPSSLPSGACNTVPSGAWDTHALGITTLAQCVAKNKDCKMAKYVSFSTVQGGDCSWYSECDMSKLHTSKNLHTRTGRTVARGEASESGRYHTHRPAYNGRSEHGLQAKCSPRYYPYQSVNVKACLKVSPNCLPPPAAGLSWEWSWGWTFSVGMAVLTAGYLSAGIALNRVRGGTDGDRGSHIPHAVRWKELWRLTQDGASFSYARLRGRGGYDSLVVTHEDASEDVDGWQKRAADATQARSKRSTLGTWMDSGIEEADANGSASSSSSAKARSKAGSASKKSKKHRSDKRKDKGADRKVRGSRSSKAPPTAKRAPSGSRSVF